MQQRTLFISGAVILSVIILVVLVLWLVNREQATAQVLHEELAICLGEQDALFYGAFWCPHCAYQKALFGRAAKKLPYVECSTKDRRGQLEVCQDKGIRGYPTWRFADNTSCGGLVDPIVLAHLSSCSLPLVEEVSVEEVFETLLARGGQGHSGESKQALRESTTKTVNQGLEEAYGTTLETEEDVSRFLDVYARVISRCVTHGESIEATSCTLRTS